MKHLDSMFLNDCSLQTPINEVSFLLDGLEKNPISEAPWAAFNYVPNVSFTMAYGLDAIFIKYFVEEKFIQAATGKSNGAVYQDACVEFFISFEEEKAYYNLEFNCIGTALVGYGETREGREFQPASMISQVNYQSVISNAQQGTGVRWQLTAVVPFTLFRHSKITSLKNKKCKANFYKCGDNLPTPHYISWSNIISKQPNFHLPEFFGTVQFK